MNTDKTNAPPRLHPWFIRLALVVAACGLGVAQDTLTEHQAKAAYLYNFAKFVEWPPDAARDSRSDVVLVVLGDENLLDVLRKAVVGKAINGRTLVAKRWKAGKPDPDWRLVFIAVEAESKLPAVIAQLEGAPVLLVGESEGFARKGGMVALVLDGDRLRFQINVEAASRARLKISSQLLSLATIVHDTNPKEGSDRGVRR